MLPSLQILLNWDDVQELKTCQNNSHCIPGTREPSIPVCHQLHTDLAGGGKKSSRQLQQFLLTGSHGEKAWRAPGTSLNVCSTSAYSILLPNTMIHEGMGAGTTTTGSPKPLGGAELIASQPLKRNPLCSLALITQVEKGRGWGAAM